MSKLFEMLIEDAETIANERAEATVKSNTKAEVAKSMLKDGEPFEKIVKYTGLTLEQVEGLVA